ncbi:GMC oxidoreductase [Devosia limi]|uniref:Choline dehydrogenase n=1 Tax=Devosia limi DSM 17137 TaxID=1121477 RepID=A0A1M4V6P1_9HYPH|nr:GMC oxidoreductase [Devosia limi]SHE64656.1 Choline dehydrogenase [Devosia limi DSM 17137]
MSIIDFQTCAPASEFDADICIIGSGPAGLTLALQFADTPLRIIVLESGGHSSDAETDKLSEIESVGMPRAPQNVTRWRGLGGTSALWSGRCGVFDAMDFQHRPWVPHSGWPIAARDLDPYLDRAGQILGLGPALYREEQERLLPEDSAQHQWDSLNFRPVVWQFSQHETTGAVLNHYAKDGVEGAQNLGMLQHSGAPRPLNLGEAARGALEASGNITVIMNATAVDLLPNSTGSHVNQVKIASISGITGTVTAKTFVLACGAIDNARLMLSSRTASEDGLGNSHGNVGRFLSDHPFWPIAKYDGAGSDVVRRMLGARWLNRAGNKHVYTLGLRVSPERQRDEELLNSALHIVEFGHEPPAISQLGSALRLLKRRQFGEDTWRALASALTRPMQLISGIYSRYVRKEPALSNPTSVAFGAVVEQVPDPESRVTLSDQVDAFGMRRARIDWRVSDREFANAKRLAELTAEEFERQGFQQPEFASWLDDPSGAFRAHIHDMAHPMSTTRMSDDPAKGVVDANCKVHEVDNLYVAGASVFSTSGYMNPTLMIVALSLRLADHLKSTAIDNRAPAAVASHRLAPRPRRTRVGLIGAGNRMREIYLPILETLADEFEVVGVTSRTAASAGDVSRLLGTQSFQTPEALLHEAKPDLLVVAIGAIDDALPGLIGLGVPLLIETPICWSLRKGRHALSLMRKHGVLVGVAEQTPELPVEALKRQVIDLGLIGRVFVSHNDFASYDYHGIAAAKQLLTGLPRSGTISAITQSGGALSHPQGQIENWIVGSARFKSGGLLMHSYSDSYHDSAFRTPKCFRTYGTSGSIVGEDMLFKAPSGQVFQAGIRRNEAAGRLQTLTIDTPIGEIVWSNPFCDFDLNDEQIAVATILRKMAVAVHFGGAPSYSAQDSFDDMELLAAMRSSARRNGAPIATPMSATYEAIERLRARLAR